MAEYPTPWRQGSGGAEAIVDANGHVVAMCDPDLRPHVIAAVNACAGISTDELEALDHGELAKEHLAFDALVQNLADAREERRECSFEAQQAKGDSSA